MGGSSVPREVRLRELDVELVVSKEIGAMPSLWLSVDDAPGTGQPAGICRAQLDCAVKQFHRRTHRSALSELAWTAARTSERLRFASRDLAPSDRLRFALQ